MVTAGGETFRLEPSKFAFYWMLAARAREDRPGAHHSDEGLERELLSYYGRVQNQYSGTYEKSELALGRSYSADNFNPNKAHVNRALRTNLGKRVAEPYLIHKLAGIPHTRYHRFGLRLPPKAIRIRPEGLRN